MSKKGKNLIIGLLLLGTVATAGVGFLSQGFQNWNVDAWKDKIKPDVSSSEDERKDLIKFDFTTETTGKSLVVTENDEGVTETRYTKTNDSISGYFKESTKNPTTIGAVAKDADGNALASNIYKDKALKFGSSSSLGSLKIELKEFTFNRMKIKGSNYTSLNNQTMLYNSDESSLAINGSLSQAFTTNALDTSKPAPQEDKIYNFTEDQSYIDFVTTGKRLMIYEIEMWTVKGGK